MMIRSFWKKVLLKGRRADNVYYQLEYYEKNLISVS